MAKIKNIIVSLLVPSGLNLRDITDGTDLVASLMARGLDVPLVVQKMSDEVYRVLRGHRRLDALQKMLALYPDAFQQWFGKGIQCEVLEGLTDEQALDVIADHGDIQALASNMEFYRLAKAKWAFKPDFTEKQILGFIGSAMSKSLTGQALIDVQALSAQINAASDNIEKAKAMIQRDERLFAACKGKLQTWNAIRRLPALAEKLLEFTYTGKEPEGVSKDLLIAVGQHQSDAMFKAWSEVPEAERSDEKFVEIVRNVRNLVAAKKAEREQKAAAKKAVAEKVAENNSAYYLKICNWIAEHHKDVYTEACNAVYAGTNKPETAE